MQQELEAGVSLSAFSQYMREVKRISPLTCDEERQLFEQLAQGVNAEQARERLVESCQGMVIGLAKRIARNARHMDFMDFVQEGNTGLLQAIDRYDNCKDDSTFKAFAFAYIRGAMLLGYWTCERAIRLPFNKMSEIRQLNVVSAKLLAKFGRDPSLAEVAQEMHMSARDVQELIVLREQQMLSLHMPLDEEDETLLEEVIEDTSASAFADAGFSSVDDILERLTEREREIFQLRYGLTDGCTYTQQEVAALLNLDLFTVQTLDRRAKMRLRRALAA
mgnify:CR=1 FL=1